MAFEITNDHPFRAYAIERGVPMPPKKRAPKKTGVGARSKYPFADMKVDDSFFIPGGKARSISPYLIRFRPKKFATRTVDGPDGKPGVRVWRIK